MPEFTPVPRETLAPKEEVAGREGEPVTALPPATTPAPAPVRTETAAPSPFPIPTAEIFRDETPAVAPLTGGTPHAPAPTPTPLPPIFSDEEFRQIAFKYISETSGVPMKDIQMKWASQVEYFRLTDVTIRFAAFDNTAKPNFKREELRTWVIAVDSNKRVVDRDAVIKAEQAARKAKYGKLDPALYDLLQNMAPEDKLQVRVFMGAETRQQMQRRLDEIRKQIRDKYPQAWLNENAQPTDKTPTELWTKTISRERLKAELEAMSLAVEPVVNYLKGLGFEARASVDAMVVATIPKSVILELEKRADVAMIGLERPMRPALNSASPSDSAPTQWQKGVSGSGQYLGVLDGGPLNPTHPYFQNRFENLGQFYQYGDHPAMVAGVAAGNRPLYRGISYVSTVLFADNWDFNEGMWRLAVYDGRASVINVSGMTRWDGEIDSSDIYADWLTRTNRRSIVVAAGNEGGYVASPGIGYNTISVGSYNDKDTLVWKQDLMAGDSSFWNPITAQKDHEKPDVAAPGVDIWTLSNTSTTNPPWIKKDSGTSVAAPAVTGTVGLMFAKKGELRDKPEAVRASVMASAIHNIDGSSTSDNSPPDDKDGQGGINTDVAVRAAEKAAASGFGWDFGDVSMTSSFNGGYWINSPSFTARKGQRIRVALAWDSEVLIGEEWDTKLSTKLWLYVDKSGTAWKDSTSMKDSFQMVDAYAPDGPNDPPEQTYTIWVWKEASTEARNYIGVAWAVVDKLWAGNELEQKEATVNIPGYGPARVVFQGVRIDSVSEPKYDSTSGNEASYEGFRAYSAKATYPTSNPGGERPDKKPVLVRRVLRGEAPFDQVDPVPYNNSPGIHNDQGYTEWSVSLPGGAYSYAPKELAKMVIMLDGSRRHAHTFYQFYVEPNQITEYLTGKNISAQTAIYREFQRGDAREDLDWDPADDMKHPGAESDADYIAQYLAGLPTPLLNFVNAATPRHDNPEDLITITDAMFIAQVLANPPIRNDYFEYIPPPGGSPATAGGQATLQIGSVAVPAGASAAVPITLKNITSQAGVGAYDIRIVFDPKLLKVESAQPGAKPFDGAPVYRIDANSGQVLINSYHVAPSGVRADTVIANLVVTPLAQAGRTAELKASVVTLADVLGNDVSNSVTNGNLAIK